MNYVILEKSRVKSFVRTRKGKFERVKEYERSGEALQLEKQANRMEWELEKKYNLASLNAGIGLYGETETRFKEFKTRIDLLKKEIDFIDKRFGFNGRNKLNIQVVGTLTDSRSRALYWPNNKTIEISPEYHESFTHEYGHFIYYEGQHISPVANQWMLRTFSDTVTRSMHRLGSFKDHHIVKGFEKMAEKIKSRPLKELLIAYGRILKVPIANVVEWEGESTTDYIVDPTEIFARVYARYLRGETNPDAGFEDTMEWKKFVKKWGDKYLKTGIVKSLGFNGKLDKIQ